MDNKEKLQNIWAMTDKSLIDIMTRKSQQLPIARNKEYSSEESDESDSDTNSDFSALPEEFRPNLNTNKAHLSGGKEIAPSQTSRKQLLQSPTSAFRKPAENKKHSNRSSPENQTSPSQSDRAISSKDDNSSVTKRGNESKIRCQTVKNMFLRQNSDKISENAAVAKRETSQKTLNAINENRLLPQVNTVTPANEPKGKKSVKYEYVQRQKQETIQLNFDLLSLKDVDPVLKGGLKYETKLTRNAPARHKNAAHTVNRVVKRSSRNSGKIHSFPKDQFPTSFHSSVIKWDNSLTLKSEEDSKIEWSYIREEKTLLTARRVSNVRRNNELLPRNYNSFHNGEGSSLNRGFNNLWQNERGCNNQNTPPQTIRKGKVAYKDSRPFDEQFNSEKFAYRNNLQSNNNDSIKYVLSARNQDFNAETESWDAEGATGTTFSQYPKCCMERRSVSTQSTENFSNEMLDLSHEKSLIDDSSWNKEIKLPLGNKEQCDFVQFQQTPKDFGCPVEGLGSKGRSGNSDDERKSRDLELKKDTILRYGREISDLIIGSYTALSMLISFYREWTHARRELISHFEQLGKILKESSKNFSRFTDVLNAAKLGIDIAQHVPHPTVAMAAKVVSVISSLLQTFLKTKKEEKANVDDSDEITKAMLKDTNSTSELYMYSLQCTQQFEETRKLIEEFHSNAIIHEYTDCGNPEITTFIRGILEFKPNHRVFYKKLHKCFQELLRTSTTSFSKRFCEPFTLCSSSTVDVIGHLGWRFRTEDFNCQSVNHELNDIQLVIQNNPTTEDLQKRIQNCVRLLREELEFMENCIKDISLFDNFSDFSKLG